MSKNSAWLVQIEELAGLSDAVLDDEPYSAPSCGAGHDCLAATTLHPHRQPALHTDSGRGALPVTTLDTFFKSFSSA
jgi:hypothetical protein